MTMQAPAHIESSDVKTIDLTPEKVETAASHDLPNRHR